MKANQRRSFIVLGAASLCSLLFTGCAENHYQPVPYDTSTLQASWKQEIALQADGNSGDEEYVDYLPALEAQIGRASDSAIPNQIAPGMAAHVGYLYLKRGDATNSRKFFEWEKSHFPESAPAMDAFLGKLKAK
jgi:hypothetical protein